MTCHVTAVSHTSSSSKRKRKRKRKQNPYKVRKRKEKKRKEKLLMSKASHNSTPLLRFCFQRNFFFIPLNSPASLLISLIPFQTFFQLLHILLLPLFSIFFPLIPILLQFFQIFLIKFLIILSI